MLYPQLHFGLLEDIFMSVVERFSRYFTLRAPQMGRPTQNTGE